MNTRLTRGVGALSSEDLETLRTMVVRRRTADAENWLVAHGFQRDRAKEIVFQQEMEIANAIYHPPVLAFALIAVVMFGIAAFLYGSSLEVPADQRDSPFIYRGAQRDLIVACMVAVPALIGAFFGVRAILGIMDKIRYRLRYRRNTDVPS